MANENKSDIKYDEKSELAIDSVHVSDGVIEQGILVNKKDKRKQAHQFNIKNTRITECIGKLICQFTDKNKNKITKNGTATVFKVYGGYSHVVTSAHNLRKATYQCTKCNQRNDKTICTACGTNEFSLKHILKADNIYFERRNTETGQLQQAYNCDMYNIHFNETQYERFPFVSGGYDIAIIRFKDDGYYQQKCTNILLVDGKTFCAMKEKKIPYFIFGFPAFMDGEENNQLYGGGSSMNAFECIRNQHQRYILKQREIDTSFGTAGAAIFCIVETSDNTFYTLIFAVHTGGEMERYNVGTLLDKSIDYLKVINTNPAQLQCFDDLIRDTLERIQQYNNSKALDKSVSKWSLQSTLNYLNCSVGTKVLKQSKVKKACKHLVKLAKNDDTCIAMLQYGALDILFNILQVCSNNIEIQMTAISGVGIICIKGFAKQYPANVNGIYDISKAVVSNLNRPKFVAFAAAAVGSFCGINDNDVHISMVIQTDIIHQIVAAMHYYRDKDQGYIVNKTACQALKNIANDTRGAAAVGTKGIEAIIQSINIYKNKNDIVEHSMQALFNLAKLKANCECIVGNGGFDLIFKQIKTAKISSSVFVWILTLFAMLLHCLPKEDTSRIVQTAVQNDIFSILNQTVKLNSKRLQEVSASIVGIIAQTSATFAKQVVNAELPSQLVATCQNNPTAVHLNNCIDAWFYVCNVFGSQQRFIDNGIIAFLTSNWYRNVEEITDGTIKTVCQLYIELLFRYNGNGFAPYYDKIMDFCNYFRVNKPQLVEKINMIESSIKNLKQW